MRLVIGFSLLALLLALAAWSFWRTVQNARRVHGDLDDYKRRALAAKTEEELIDLEVSLRVYAAKNCFGPHFSSHAREICYLILGIRKGISR